MLGDVVAAMTRRQQPDDDGDLVELADLGERPLDRASQVISRSSNMKSRKIINRKMPPNAAIAGCAAVSLAAYSCGWISASWNTLTGESGRQRHHDDREEQPHAEDGDDDAEGQEEPLPPRVHPAQHGRIDDRVVERQRDLEDGQDRHDERRSAAHR